MRIIKAKNGFIVDVEDGVNLPTLCINRKELHVVIDEVFSDVD